ncbi:pantoate--beta-alanine ligase [Myroides sp. LJL115]
MFLFSTKAELQEYLNSFRQARKTIGLVPTMGAIHQGHLSLMQQSITENDCTVVSIFVNPTQFNNSEDLENYPRTLDRDMQTIATISDKIVIFAPSVEEMYSDNAVAQNFVFDGLESQMEGAQRPGHFNGVGTIVKKLFELVKPTNAYFGEKDFQQLLIIKKLVKNYNIPVNIIGVPIFRTSEGLAMSSRNERISKQGLDSSLFLYQVLNKAKEIFQSESIDKVNLFVANEFKNNPNFELEYFTIAEEETLLTATQKETGKSYRGFLVAHIEGIRLIDNLKFN